MVEIWYCDPSKNEECKKTGCFVIGGPCHLTFDKRNAVVIEGHPLKGPVFHEDGGAENGAV